MEERDEEQANGKYEESKHADDEDDEYYEETER